jgi:hypothetical protein
MENQTVPEHLRSLVSVLPDSPGVYQYFNAEGTIIYVGKAKNLKKRVSSYFIKKHDSTKTAVLIKKIHDIKYIVVNSEEDALLLENSLIKQYQPRYNVLLKDDLPVDLHPQRGVSADRVHAPSRERRIGVFRAVFQCQIGENAYRVYPPGI